MLTEQDFDNTVLYLELGPEDSGKEIDITYQVERKEKGPYEAEGPDRCEIPTSKSSYADRRKI
jgi:hypothetical protein